MHLFFFALALRRRRLPLKPASGQAAGSFHLVLDCEKEKEKGSQQIKRSLGPQRFAARNPGVPRRRQASPAGPERERTIEDDDTGKRCCSYEPFVSNNFFVAFGGGKEGAD